MISEGQKTNLQAEYHAWLDAKTKMIKDEGNDVRVKIKVPSGKVARFKVECTRLSRYNNFAIVEVIVRSSAAGLNEVFTQARTLPTSCSGVLTADGPVVMGVRLAPGASWGDFAVMGGIAYFNVTVSYDDAKPDLVVSAASAGKTRLNKNYSETTSLDFSIRNSGAATAGASKATVSRNGLKQAEFDIPELSPGSSARKSFVIRSADLSVGRHAFSVRADAEDVLREDSEGNNSSESISVEVCKNTTVFLNASPGSLSQTSLTRIAGDPYGTLPTPTCYGRTFLGWYTLAGSRVTPQDAVPLEDLTLYARWNQNYVSVTFRGKEPISVDNRIFKDGWLVTNLTYAVGEAYGRLPSAEEAKRAIPFVTFLDKFSGWWTEIDGGTRVHETDVARDTVKCLFARWNVAGETDPGGGSGGGLDFSKIVTVKFEPGGGAFPDSINAKVYTEGEPYGTFLTAHWSGHEFLGWYADSSFSRRVYESDIVAKSVITLYAKWSSDPASPRPSGDGKPNLTFLKPTDWPDKVYLSRSSNGSSVDTSFTEGEDVYFCAAYGNSGDAPSSGSFSVRLRILDGSRSVCASFVSTNKSSSVSAGAIAAWWLNSQWGAFGKLTAGSYVFETTVDCYGEIPESNEGDNTCTVPFQIVRPAVARPTALSATCGTRSDGVSVSWSAPAGESTFDVYRSTDVFDRPSAPLVRGVTSSWLDRTAVPGVAYHYWVVASGCMSDDAFSAPTWGYRSGSLALGTERMSVSASTDVRSVRVTSNVKWHAQSRQDWLTLVDSSGTGDGVLSFRVNLGLTTEEQTGEIWVSADYDGLGQVDFVRLTVVVEPMAVDGFSIVDGVLESYDGADADVVVPEGVLEIGRSAFSCCSEVKSVRLPESLRKIGEWAFFGCRQLETIEIPKSVESIGEVAFSACDRLDALTVAEGSPYFRIADGILYSSDWREVLWCARNVVRASIHDGAESIGDYAFYECTALERVSLPATLRRIGRSAFQTTHIGPLVIPAGVTEIGDEAFASCGQLTTVSFLGNAPRTGLDIYKYGNAKRVTCVREGSTGWRAAGDAVLPALWPTGDENACPIVHLRTLTGGGSEYDVPAIGGTTNFVVEVGGSWRATASSDWIELIVGEGTSGDILCYQVASNTNSIERQGAVTVTGPDGRTWATVRITQGADPVLYFKYWLRNDGNVTISGYTGSGSAVSVPAALGGRPVAAIGDKAFMDCKTLKSVSIPETVTAIGWRAFSGCDELADVSFPSGLREIGGCAFEDCSALESALLPDAVAKVGSSAFAGCTKLRQIAFPSGLKQIESFCCYGCESLKDVALPEDLESVGQYAFDSSALNSIVLPDAVTNLDSYAFGSCTSLVTVVLGHGLVQIGDYAFSECSSLVSVSMGEGLRRIGRSAFYKCSSLVFADLPAGVTEIGDYAFAWCDSLPRVLVPNGVADLAASVYRGCSSLETVVLPSGLKRIEEGAFAFCESLEDIEIPKAVSWVGAEAFSYCGGLKSLRFFGSPPSVGDPLFNYSVKGAVAYVPYGATEWRDPGTDKLPARWPDGQTYALKLKWADSPLMLRGFDVEDGVLVRYVGAEREVVIPEGVTAIRSKAFADCTSVASVSIPGFVKEVGQSAFMNCTGLKSVMIQEGVEVLGAYAFSGCTSLSSVKIPASVSTVPMYAFEGSGLLTAELAEGVAEISSRAFEGCSGLRSIAIPSTVVTIGMRAFSGCSSLSRIAIPQGVAELNGEQFSGCAGLVEISVDERHPEFASVDGVVYDKDLRKIVAYPAGRSGPAVILDGVNEIGSSAFRECTALTSVVLPEGVKSVSAYAFCGCSNLATLILPESLEKIECAAFYADAALTSVQIPSGVTSIETDAFEGCTGLQSVEVEGANPKYSSVDGLLCSKDGTTLLDCPDGRRGALTVPQGVTELGSHAFAGCGLTSIVVGGQVRTTGYQAFAGCPELRVVAYETDLAAGLRTASVDSYLFSDSAKLETVILPPDLDTIPQGMFHNCSNLVSAVIPPGVTNIGSWAFWYCTSLETVTIPPSVREIGMCAFYRCGRLRAVDFSADERRIMGWPPYSLGDSAFGYCESLESVELPAGVKDIPEGLLEHCTDLREVIVPSGVETVGERAFWGCTSLLRVKFPASLKSLEKSYIFVSCGNLRTVVFDGNAPTTYLYMYQILDNEDLVSYVLPGSTGWRSDGGTGLPERWPEDSWSLGRQIRYQEKFLAAPENVTADEGASAEGVRISWTLPEGAVAGYVYRSTDPVCPSVPLARCVRSPYVDETAEAGRRYYYWVSAVNCQESAPAGGVSGSRAVSLELDENVQELPQEGGRSNVLVRANAPWSAVASADWVKILDAGGGALVYSVSSNVIAVARIAQIVVTAGEGLDGGSVCRTLEVRLRPRDFPGFEIREGTVVGYSGLGGSVVIPPGVTHIGEGAFAGNSSVREVILSDDVASVDAGAFADCENLVGFVVSPANRWFKSVDGVLYSSDGTTLMACPCFRKGDFRVPAGVLKIAGKAFAGCAALTSVVLPETVAEIGEFAFCGCRELRCQVLPSSVVRLGWGSFVDCLRLNAVVFEGDEPEVFGMMGTGQMFSGCPDGRVVAVKPEADGWRRDGKFPDCWPSGPVDANESARFGFFAGESGILVVLLDPNGGSVTYSAWRCSPGDIYSGLPEATRQGYAFDCWCRGTDGSIIVDGATSAAVGEDCLVAAWDPVQYEISFDPNGGCGEMPSEPILYGVAFALPDCSFEKNGYAFAGWSRMRSGQPAFQAGDVVSNLTAEAGGRVTLYAQWTANEYAVDFNPGQGGTGSMPDQPMIYDEAEALYPNLFHRTGYTFLGWTDDPNEVEEVLYYDGAVVENLTDEVDGEFDLYAIWAANEYTVKFNANGGKGSMADQAFLYDEAQNLMSNGFTRAGCEFLGWTATEDGGSTVYADGEAVSNLTATADGVVNLYAVWNGEATTWKEDDSFSAAVANTYDGYMIDENYNLLGVVQVKTTKQVVKKTADKKTKVTVVTTNITATATVTDANGKKWSYSKGVVTVDGIVPELKCTTKGCPVPTFGVTLGKNGMEGVWGEYAIFGARNGMDTKGDAMKAALEAYKGKWSVTLSAPRDEGAAGTVRLQLDVQAKGVVKIAGNWESGAKVSASAQMVMGDSFAYVPMMVKSTKTSPAVNALLRIDAGGEVALLGEGDAARPESAPYQLIDGGRTVAAIEIVGYLAENPVKAGAAYVGRVALNELAYPAKFTQKGLPTGLKIDATTGVVSGTPTKPGEYTVTFTATSSMNSKSKDAVDVTIKVDNYVDGLIPVEDYYGPYTPGVSYTVTIPAADGCTVSGLPTGMKWTAKDVKAKDGTVTTPANSIYGIPTKPGKYTVYFKKSVSELNAKNKSVKVTHTATATFEVADYPTITLLPSLAIAGSEPMSVAEGAELSFFVGVKQSFAIGLAGTLDGVDTTVAAKGLPTGLKLVKKTIYVDPTAKKKLVDHYEYVIEGVPTKASSLDKQKNVVPSHVTLTASNKYKWSGTFTFDITVVALPAWVYGTFDGGNTNGMATLTVSNVGKLSGKWMSEGLTWTLSAASYDAYYPDDAKYVVTVIGKSGKLTMTNEVEVTENGVSSPLFEAWRNGWKEEPQKSLATKLKGQKVQVGEALLTVGASGAVTAKGAFVTGFDETKQKDITYSATCSTVLIPTAEAGVYRIYLYFPPKSGKFDGFSACESVMFAP